MERLRGAVAHTSTTLRTTDVTLSENITFESMLLNQNTLNGLHKAGFLRPSPVQRCAIPAGRCGTDLIVQAKSGTGKTLVFSIIALEMIDLSITRPQVLILVPTREIAVQIKEILTSISVEFPNINIQAFIGGLAVSDDITAAKGCQIAVGTPGRVKDLVRSGSLSTQAVRLFVLDEADRMVDKTFLKDVCYLFSKLPERKQSIVSSATYPEKMEKLLTTFLVHPQRINPSTDTLLLGLRQYVAVVPAHTNMLARIRNKTNKLLDILSTLVFRQCLIFCNIQSRMESICRDLASRGWPTLHLGGSMPQKERLAAIAALQNHRCRILLTTDLAARGVDAEQVDLVVNLDLPYNTETYLHRIGRAGRFGSPGIAISIVDDNELQKLRAMFFDVAGSAFKVPILPAEISIDIWNDSSQLEEVEALARESNEIETSNEPELITDSSLENEETIKILRSELIQLPKKFQPIPFLQLLKSFNENTEMNDMNNGLECLGLVGKTEEQGAGNSLDEKESFKSSEEEKEVAVNNTEECRFAELSEKESVKLPSEEEKEVAVSDTEECKFKELSEEESFKSSEEEEVAVSDTEEFELEDVAASDSEYTSDSLESSSEEESSGNFQNGLRSHQMNVLWRQQQLYIEEMCRFASKRTQNN